jgi:hypothetical protein
MDIYKLERFRYVLNLTNVSEEKIKSTSRKRELVNIRQMLMYFCVTELDMGLKETGSFMGDKDHSTVIHGRDKFRDLLSIPNKGNIEAQRYKYILKKYKEKFGDVAKNRYICVDSLIELLRIQLTELEAKNNLTPIQEVVNNAKKTQLEKIINTVKNEYTGKMDSRIAPTRKITNGIKSELYNV